MADHLQTQCTLKKTFGFSGVGLHSGRPAAVVFRPASANTGIVFCSGQNKIAAIHEHVIETQRGTTLGKNGIVVRTVEHVLSALNGMGVDNAYVDFEGDEMPAMDGSAWPCVKAIRDAGLEEIPGSVKPVLHFGDQGSFVFTTGLSSYKVMPADRLILSVSISFPNTPIGVQDFGFVANGAYPEEISRARTFCLESDVPKLRAAGLAKGGSLANTIVVGTQSVQCEEPLRYKDEFVRHKILDLLGDLSLLGMGSYHFNCIAFAPSHTANW
ncbi:MAG: UDP-3-O-acyl-N-acetylglucosamine deacetylase, partial [Elusimicrobiota bacterium]